MSCGQCSAAAGWSGRGDVAATRAHTERGIPGFDADALFRLNLGGGVDLGAVALMAELVNLTDFDDFDDVEDERFVHTFTLSARFMGELVQPLIGLGVPLDDFGRRNVDFFVVAGLQVMLH